MLHFLWNLIIFVFSIMTLIIIHELGHFCFARLYGLKVKRFAIGYGAVIWKRIDRLGTEYIISAIPIGGYVEILKEDNHNNKIKSKPIWQRALIIMAGSMFNFILAIFLYWIVFLIGLPNYNPLIEDVIPNTGVVQTNILNVSSPIYCHSNNYLKQIIPNQTKLNLLLFENKVSLFKHRYFCDINFNKFNILKFNQLRSPESYLVTFNYENIKTNLYKFIKIYNQLHNKVQKNSVKLLTITMLSHVSTEHKLIIVYVNELFHNIITLPIAYQYVKHVSFIKALYQATLNTIKAIHLTFSMLVNLLTGKITITNFHLMGPISIAHGASVAATYGFVYYLMFLASISINLGVVNLLPIPILDGGLLLFLAIEKLKGSPISEKVQRWFYQLGFVCLVMLMGLAFYNDISKLNLLK